LEFSGIGVGMLGTLGDGAGFFGPLGDVGVVGFWWSVAVAKCFVSWSMALNCASPMVANGVEGARFCRGRGLGQLQHDVWHRQTRF
jgi:hypothetical protein